MSLIVLVGQSGSGKSTIARMLEERMNIPRIKGYTDRPKRDIDDNEYHFTDLLYYHTIPKDNILCETEIDGYRYWKCKTEIVGDIQTIIVDTKGLRELYDLDYPMTVIYIVSDWQKRLDDLVGEYMMKGKTRNKAYELAFKRMDRDKEFEKVKCDFAIDGNCTINELYNRVETVIKDYVL